jgi:leader peptidase (prepilin peptidase) / N-methyltransferase
MLSIFSFILGTFIGSFLNVVLFRTPQSTSVIKGRSHCQQCKKPIAWQDLIPILSYLRLRGKCRNCKKVFSWQYPVIEFATGFLFLLVVFRYGQGWFLPQEYLDANFYFFVLRDWILISFLFIIFVYDLRHMLILDRFTVPAMVIAFGANLILGYSAASLIIGAACFGGFFLVQYLVSRGQWIGGGDIRMGVLIGLLLGIGNGFIAMFLAYILGALLGLLLIALKKVNRKTQLPMGTFLVVATLLVLFSGDWLTERFLVLIG